MYIKLLAGRRVIAVKLVTEVASAHRESFFGKPDVNKIYSFFANVHPTIQSGGFCYGRIFTKLRNIIGKGF